MKYDPEITPEPGEWLSLDEEERIELVLNHHRRIRAKLPKAQLHAVIHVIVENQLAEGFEATRETLKRLQAEGLDRHEAIHAIGSVVVEHLCNLWQEEEKTPDSYSHALRTLTVASWVAGAG